MIAFGWSVEDLELILTPMVLEMKEATGSMGDDSVLASLSKQYRGLHHYFRQNFSQVTNPPIDSLREKVFMSLRTRLGNINNILDESPIQCQYLQLNSPILSNTQFATMQKYLGNSVKIISTTFNREKRKENLKKSLASINKVAESAIKNGIRHLILTDKTISKEEIPIPMILVTSSVHNYLVKKKLRTLCSINIQSGECLDTHYFAILIGMGATSVNAYLAQEAITYRFQNNLFNNMKYEECVKRYTRSVKNGILKIMSKMGISVVSSYRGGGNFEAIGLSKKLIKSYFPTITSRISGINLSQIEEMLISNHNKAFSDDFISLPVGGFYRFRESGMKHAFSANIIHTLQKSVTENDYLKYINYSKLVDNQDPINIRDLLKINFSNKSKKLKKIIKLKNKINFLKIRKKLNSPGISFGALSFEAHETLAIAMNRIGCKSNSGEGGEDRKRYKIKKNGDNSSSAIKQIASARFGVTSEYLNNCQEIEIKIAQGAKPGEGGQIPGKKVTPFIAKLRYASPGITLISPPPHHDIYSIEDLSQLIYDLKQINPKARVCVKLVAQSGIGTVAVGVAKAKADTILISGHSGGTGASPQTSIKYAGIPWELGLSEVHQLLSLNNLRDKVILRTDGGLKTGKDIVTAAILGAEEFGIGTASLIAMGCIMQRKMLSLEKCSQELPKRL